MSMKNNKSLGQHWLKDRDVLGYIAELAELSGKDSVLEIGPGLGTLTSVLLKKSKDVVAVEFDENLAGKLPNQFPGTNLKVINQDILSFNLDSMPKNYKVVANVPYYITSKIVKMLMTAQNKPSIVVLLVQKEVAERLGALPGNLSILGISAQVFADVSLGDIVPAELFTPPPKVDSQVVVLKTKTIDFFADVDESKFFRIVKAGFSAKRKMLRSSLAGGLKISKLEAETVLINSNIDPTSRAEDLSLNQWVALTKALK